MLFTRLFGIHGGPDAGLRCRVGFATGTPSSTLRVFSPAQSVRFTPAESTPNPPRRFLADFYQFEVRPSRESTLDTGEAATPDRFRLSCSILPEAFDLSKLPDDNCRQLSDSEKWVAQSDTRSPTEPSASLLSPKPRLSPSACAREGRVALLCSLISSRLACPLRFLGAHTPSCITTCHLPKLQDLHTGAVAQLALGAVEAVLVLVPRIKASCVPFCDRLPEMGRVTPGPSLYAITASGPSASTEKTALRRRPTDVLHVPRLGPTLLSQGQSSKGEACGPHCTANLFLHPGPP